MTSPEQQPLESETTGQETEFYYLYKVFKNFKEQIFNKIESKDDREQLYHALTVAIKTHEGQTRRISGLPYIVHPIEVATKALQATDNVDILISCLLHDGPEDRPKRLNDAISDEDINDVVDEDHLPLAEKIDYIIDAYGALEYEFGTNVAKIVFGVTKNIAEDTWRNRARVYIKAIEFDAPDESSIVCAADKICNLSNRLKEYEHAKNKEEISHKFNSDINDQLWWFTANLDMLRRKSEKPGFKYRVDLKTLLDELKTLVDEFQELVDNLDTVHGVASYAGAVACKTKD